MRWPSFSFLSLEAAILLSAILAVSSCLQTEPRRPAVKYLIPKDYVGWIKIEYGVPGEPQLPVEDGRITCQIPSSGELRTSSEIQFGVAKDEYYYFAAGSRDLLRATGWGGGGMIWGGFNGQEFDANKQPVKTYLEFFVGSEDEYKKHLGEPGLKKPGPIQH